jgi:hypothetical protein
MGGSVNFAEKVVGLGAFEAHSSDDMAVIGLVPIACEERLLTCYLVGNEV